MCTFGSSVACAFVCMKVLVCVLVMGMLEGGSSITTASEASCDTFVSRMIQTEEESGANLCRAMAEENASARREGTVMDGGGAIVDMCGGSVKGGGVGMAGGGNHFNSFSIICIICIFSIFVYFIYC